MDPRARLTELLEREPIRTARAILDVYGAAPGGLLANGLAFAALFAIVPVALVTLGIAGVLVGDPTIQSQLAVAIGAAIPPVRSLVDDALASMSSGARLTSALGFVGLLWTVSRFYVTLDIAFARIFTEVPQRDMVRQNARSFVWVVGLVGVVTALVVAGSLAAAAEVLLPTSTSALLAFGRVISSPPVVVAIGATIVTAVYRVVPAVAPGWRALLFPAVMTGTAIVILSQVFLFVAPRIVGAAAVAGSLAAAFIALAWLSFTFQLLLLGAAWVRIRDAGRTDAVRSALARPATPAEARVRGQ